MGSITLILTIAFWQIVWRLCGDDGCVVNFRYSQIVVVVECNKVDCKNRKYMFFCLVKRQKINIVLQYVKLYYNMSKLIHLPSQGPICFMVSARSGNQLDQLHIKCWRWVSLFFYFTFTFFQKLSKTLVAVDNGHHCRLTFSHLLIRSDGSLHGVQCCELLRAPLLSHTHPCLLYKGQK